MCVPFTLVYVCDGCIEAGHLTGASVIVKPDAQDPVRGGYNHEGRVCRMRYHKRPFPAEQLLKPNECPALTAVRQAEDELFTGRTRQIFGELQHRIWFCPAHRPQPATRLESTAPVSGSHSKQDD